MSPSRLLLVAALALSACASGSDAPAGEARDEGGEGGGSTAENTGGGGASGGGGEACLRGTWAADAEHTFRPETWQRLMQQGQQGAQGQEAPSIRLGETSGRALITFEPDGTLRQRFEDFRVVFESDAGGMPMTMAMNMSGSNEARYTADGDRLTFLPDASPGGGDMRATVDVEVGGQQMPTQTMDPSMFEQQEGSEGTVVTYDCRGDELLLDIASEEEQGQIFFDDARYTRAG